MANYIIDGTLLTNIGAAIRAQKDVTTKYTPAQMATAILGLQAEVADTTYTININAGGAEIPPGGSKTVTATDRTTGATLDLSKVAIVSASFEYNSGYGVFISAVDPANNTITLSLPAGVSMQTSVSSVTLGYRGLTIY